ncbi:hypothetical protein [Oceanirhabdus sp. W0125-5]|nr:hypothetical protein [Oceanirhabdus sp. W0125-5]WBW96537.1 hypothetical protein OW730_23015 [Oceanirhabdus sp. W0125-5]
MNSLFFGIVISNVSFSFDTYFLKVQSLLSYVIKYTYFKFELVEIS